MNHNRLGGLLLKPYCARTCGYMSGSAVLGKCPRVPFFPSCVLAGHAESNIIPRRRPSVGLDWICASRCVFLWPLLSDGLEHPRTA
jgi:hypothetical protein